MVFNSYIFVFALLPLCLLGYFGLNYINKNSISKCFLIGISLWFYAYFHLSYLLLIVSSTIFNYLSYRLSISVEGRRRIICIITVIANLLTLGIFKYYDFFINSINSAFGTSIPLLKLLLPLGISFFTFQQIAFTIDTYNREAFYSASNRKAYTFIDYALFISFFPQLIAGPIVSHNEIIPQFADKEKRHFNYENFSKGIFAFVLGLSKKVLIADVLAIPVNYGFGIASELNTPSALFIMILFTLQLYFDFSGYSDMARGLGFMLNFNLPLNFDSPFKTRNIAEFWNRWHITLSRFFTKYIYIPLGGNRRGLPITCLNVIIIFTLSGLWHGAEWTFIIWGIINGLGVCLVRIFKSFSLRRLFQKNKIVNAILTITNFLFISFAFIFFRADNLSHALDFIKSLFSMNFTFGIYPNIFNNFQSDEALLLLKLTFLDDFMFSYILPGIIYTIVSLFIIFFMKNVNEMIINFKPHLITTLYTAVLFIWCIYSFSGISTFIYYNF